MPIVLVKTMQHVKTSKHITHVLVWLDFKVSTVKQVLIIKDCDILENIHILLTEDFLLDAHLPHSSGNSSLASLTIHY